MDLKKIGQLMVVGFKGIKPSDEIIQLIRNYHIGGIILFGRNIGTAEEVRELTANLQLEAKQAGYERPLLICIDQENGAVRRLGEGATILPGAMLQGATHHPANAYEIGKVTGKELKALGINWNLSPVVDVNNNPNNPVIGVRSFGETPEQVTEFAREAVRGMQEEGVMATLKHFPGHGDTAVDSHLDLPVISHHMERLNKVELVPFKECLKAGAATIMSAHVYFPAIEPEENRPATLSKHVITGLLREQLGFQGVVTTDCMEMNAISERIGTPRGGVEAVKAGVDLIMVSHLYDRQVRTIEAIKEAWEEGEIEEGMIEAALDRINQLKDQYLSWEDSIGEGKVPEYVGSREHHEIARKVYERGITIVENKNHIIPIDGNRFKKILVVYPANEYAVLVEDKRYATMSLGESIKACHPETELIELERPINDEKIQAAVKQAESFDLIIVATLSAASDSPQAKLVQDLNKTGKPVIVVATRSPYDWSVLPDLDGYVCTYEFTQPALQIAAEALFGKTSVSGKLPVTLMKK